MSVKIKRHRFVLLSAAILLSLAVTFLLICFHLATQETGQSDPGTPEDGFLETVLRGSLFGDEFSISEAKLNTYANEKYCTPFSENGSGITQLRVKFHKKKSPELFAEIYTHGQRLSIHSCFDINTHSGGEITLSLHDLSVGSLRIPDFFLSAALSQLIRSADKYKLDGSSIMVQAKYEHIIKNSSVKLMLTELRSCEGYVLCRTNSLTSEALRAVGDYLSSREVRQKISEKLSDLADEWFS